MKIRLQRVRTQNESQNVLHSHRHTNKVWIEKLYVKVFQWNMKYNHYSTGQIKFNYTLYKWSISNIYQGKYFENNTVKMSDNLKKVFK